MADSLLRPTFGGAPPPNFGEHGIQRRWVGCYELESHSAASFPAVLVYVHAYRTPEQIVMLPDPFAAGKGRNRLPAFLPKGSHAFLGAAWIRFMVRPIKALFVVVPELDE
jgi:hypothetical protein